MRAPRYSANATSLFLDSYMNTYEEPSRIKLLPDVGYKLTLVNSTVIALSLFLPSQVEILRTITSLCAL